MLGFALILARFGPAMRRSTQPTKSLRANSCARWVRCVLIISIFRFGLRRQYILTSLR